MKKKFKTLLEFVKKEETEHGAIPLLEHWKFAKEIWKIAKKFWFDCYAKWYPAEKLNYTPTGETFEIKTVEDIAKLSPGQFEFFIDDLRSFCSVRRSVDSLNQALGIDIIETPKEWMTWIDSWLNEAKLSFETTNKI